MLIQTGPEITNVIEIKSINDVIRNGNAVHKKFENPTNNPLTPYSYPIFESKSESGAIACINTLYKNYQNKEYFFDLYKNTMEFDGFSDDEIQEKNIAAMKWDWLWNIVFRIIVIGIYIGAIGIAGFFTYMTILIMFFV